jgi:hypothetical protein
MPTDYPYARTWSERDVGPIRNCGIVRRLIYVINIRKYKNLSASATYC